MPTEHTRFGFHPDDTTPIPRPSRYHGRRQPAPVTEALRDTRIESGVPPASPPLAPGQDPSPGKIDKAVLTLAEPKRRRDKSHLRFVASQPCLICGRHPSDPHHLRFAQPRALGVKVSDEFTVPLCRGHHRQLHQAGNEIAGWKNLNIDALSLARQLWEKTHPNEGQTQTIESTVIDLHEDQEDDRETLKAAIRGALCRPRKTQWTRFFSYEKFRERLQNIINDLRVESVSPA